MAVPARRPGNGGRGGKGLGEGNGVEEVQRRRLIYSGVDRVGNKLQASQTNVAPGSQGIVECNLWASVPCRVGASCAERWTDG